MKTSKRFKWAFLLILVSILAFMCWPIISIMFPGLNCTNDEINIKTGQSRHSRCIAFVKVSENVYDTPLSEALMGRTVNKTDIKAWHPVNTFAPPSKQYSPHYHFHGALHQAQEVGMLFKEISAPPPLKAEIAEKILDAWQTTGGDDGAKNVLQKLWEKKTNKLEQ